MAIKTTENIPSAAGRVLLCSMPFSAGTPGIGPRFENLGLCYLLAYLNHHGIEGEIFDANAAAQSFDQFLALRRHDGFLLIGFSVFSTNYRATLDAVAMLRDRGYGGHIVLGGHYPSFNYRTILSCRDGIDTIITGEGEKPLLALVQALKAGRPFGDIRSLAWKEGGEIVRNPSESLIDDLNMPFYPERSFYHEVVKRQNFVTLSSSRGCWGACSFCSVRNFYALSQGGSWRYRSAEHVVDEIEHVHKTLGVFSFAFFDDNFIGPGAQGKKRALAVARQIMKRKLDIVFSVECRPDDMDRPTMEVLREAGLVKVSMGIESLVPRQQRLYNKTLTAETVSAALSILKDLDLLYSLYFILFDPYVTFDDLHANFGHIREFGPEHVQNFASFLQVFPGIPVYGELERSNMLGEKLICATEHNEYWISYSFENPQMSPMLAMWLRLEEAMKFLFGSYVPVMDDERSYEAYKTMRLISFLALSESIEQGFSAQGKDHFTDLLEKIEKAYLSKAEAFLRNERLLLNQS